MRLDPIDTRMLVRWAGRESHPFVPFQGEFASTSLPRTWNVDIPSSGTDIPVIGSSRQQFLRSIQASMGVQLKQERLAVLCVDVDRYRRMHTSFGPEICSQIVSALQRLVGAVCGSRLIAIGQVSAGVVAAALSLPGECQPLHYAKSITAALEAPLRVQSDLHVCLTANIGVAVHSDRRAGLEQALEYAETAVHQAKIEAGDGYAIFDADQLPEASQRIGRELLLNLQRAICRHELSLAFQPKVDLKNGDCVGAEVLLRWRHPILGDISPSDFIPVAEDSGLIGPIGDWTLREAVASIARSAQAGHRGRLAINVSARQLGNRHFVGQLKSILEQHGVAGSAIEIEVTESAVLANTAVAARRLSELKALGITVALDDFGTGYATLALLKQLPIDTLKIAPEFIHDIVDKPASAKLVEGIIKMAHLMNLRVVAEGIETQAQAELLIEYGCDIGQGYLFCRPVGHTGFLEWIGRD